MARTLTRWDPFRELAKMQSQLQRLLSGSASPMPREKQEALTVAQWAPLVDISEDDKEYVIKAELPEMNKEDIKVNLQDNVLTMSGERRSDHEEKTKKYHRVERAYGNFVRTFTLPEDADASKIDAQYKDGVLTIHMSKSQQQKQRTIDVKVA